ncbi:unnamed protein product (macronuclear) [Paramecium tetraurelia]|uniref:Transmembrane protein n=1 Tax=Paramecium tetraurelia TaxID=5888 RepID=A0CWA7_PARTE|nr:uncharacterized protein GSPATT00001276001 [Paramecium tetraurelia]CAK75074.1 unnamed protein product [Paramecium tetraurelia]|eukprot:XP_001442471.1 hypothetical protein (macronuclear) [Paramecium tetraurelia strain d4-2]
MHRTKNRRNPALLNFLTALVASIFLQNAGYKFCHFIYKNLNLNSVGEIHIQMSSDFKQDGTPFTKLFQRLEKIHQSPVFNADCVQHQDDVYIKDQSPEQVCKKLEFTPCLKSPKSISTLFSIKSLDNQKGKYIHYFSCQINQL